LTLFSPINWSFFHAVLHLFAFCISSLIFATGTIENSAYGDIIIHEELELVIWGVVTNVIHSV
jgi:hypothetical protein